MMILGCSAQSHIRNLEVLKTTLITALVPCSHRETAQRLIPGLDYNVNPVSHSGATLLFKFDYY